MKRIILILSLILFVAFYVSAQTAIYKIIELTFEKEVVDLGTFAEDSGPKECIFKYKNNNDVPVSIDYVGASCGCTKVVYSTKPVMPGECGEIKVTYTNDMGALLLDKRITVYVNTTAKATYLKIIGTVTESL